MRSMFIAVVLFFLLIGNAQAVDQQFVYKNAALVATSVTVPFVTAAGNTIKAKYLKIENRSASAVDVCVNLTGDVAAVCATDWSIPQNENLVVEDISTTRVTVICSAAGPCTVRILAVN